MIVVNQFSTRKNDCKYELGVNDTVKAVKIKKNQTRIINFLAPYRHPIPHRFNFNC